MLNKLIFATLTLLLLTFGGLSNSMAGPALGGGCGGKGQCADKLDPQTPVESEGMQYMREEEKLARDIYLILGDKWELIVFENIARAEQNHMDAVKTLIDKYGVEDPVVEEAPASEGDEFTHPDLGEAFDDFKDRGLDSATMALQVGGEIEETDIWDIRNEILLADKGDIISTYENLLCASANHLRAFVKQLDINGESYVPLGYLEPGEIAAIVEAPIARKCGNSD